MFFNSYLFIFAFLPLTVFLYYALIKINLLRHAKVLLVVASCVFYAYWNVKYVVLLLFSIFFNYAAGQIMHRYRKKTVLVSSVAVNLLLLGYFKYANFFLESFSQVLNQEFTALNIILPLGISFFTFQQISFLVDNYRGETEPSHFLDYMLYVSFFPKLIAGPIVRQKEMIPQILGNKNAHINYQNICVGIIIFFIGLFKKVIIADYLAGWANPGFDLSATLTFFEAWGAAASYTFQLYFDFAGYSEMAIGIGLLFNITLPVNFSAPYKSGNIIEFWSRWHITLSEFLKKYLYVSLGGNRRGKLRKYVNLLVTMLLGGLWHGAGWTFVIWGGLHGIYLIVNHLTKDIKHTLLAKQGDISEVAIAGTRPNLLTRLITLFSERIVTFAAVLFAWVFFRAQTIHDAFKVLAGLFGINGIQFSQMTYLPDAKYKIIILSALFVWVNFEPDTFTFSKKFKPNWYWLVFLSLLALLSILNMNRITDFLYFQF